MVAKWCVLAMCLLVAVGADKCPRATDQEAKQKRMLEVLQHVNKPYVAETKDPKIPAGSEDVFKHLGILEKHEVFSLFDERQWDEATTAAVYMLTAPSFDEFIDRAEIVRHRINEDMFYYAFSVAAVHRDDTRGINLPRIHEIYPDKFLKHKVIVEVKNSINSGQEDPLIDATHEFTDLRDPNSKLHYFLEDVGLNSHHYHWHVIHPAVWQESLEELTHQHKDRKGELFYFMHHQMVNRYDAERLSNGLPRSTTFENWNDPIETGYAPHLTIDRTGYRYQFRPDNLVVRDLPELTKNHMRQWRDRILYAVHRGEALAANGSSVSLRDERGIDVLGNMVESSLQSINRPFYGNVHCYAHVIAARIADPDGKYGEDNGAMYDVATSARDPLFYQWHKFIDNLFHEYKDALKAYSSEDLTYNDITIEEVNVQGEGGSPANTVTTFLENSIVHLDEGFSFTARGHARVKVQHLQHEGFNYQIKVNNAGGEHKVVFRVFLAPKYDEEHHEFDFNEQRGMAIELDKFVATVPAGSSTVEQHSSKSSVTQSNDNFYGSSATRSSENHCSCGWPDYLLIPKGNHQGVQFNVYVIATSYDEDHVESDESCHCGDSLSYCGALYDKYPDRRPMGYPFDRHADAQTFDEFKTKNMNSVTVTIKHTGEVKDA
uniref:Hemocyanin subunit B n=1 Tax=Scutigera coleoptrata TaxID=29022 RepID=HCYB_SCUCO|nr:RecName: Full=Hemocyanin subunit B; Flags: Precursor [Scutigera coleoptrata]CAD55132.1 hemocyanin subunit B [Scutigera coleoptrata]